MSTLRFLAPDDRRLSFECLFRSTIYLNFPIQKSNEPFESETEVSLPMKKYNNNNNNIWHVDRHVGIVKFTIRRKNE